MEGYRLQLFGRVALHMPEGAIANFGTVRAAKLLVLVATSPTGSVSRDRLANRLWPDEPLDATRLRLRQEIHRLRRVFGEDGSALQATSSEVSIAGDLLISDLDLFDTFRNSLVDWDESVLVEEFLPGWDDPWVLEERKRAGDLQIQRVLALSQVCNSDDERKCVHALLQKLISRFPLNEELVHASMRLHASGGSLVGAVTEYQALRKRLLLELGVEPSKGSEELLVQITTGPQEEVVGNKVSDPQEEVQAKQNSLRPESSIPHPIENLIGRSSDMDRLLSLVGDSSVRLITLTGPGGIGKTRLAIELGHRIQSSFEGTVHFVSLADALNVADWARITLDHWNLALPADVDSKRYLTRLLSSEVTWLIADNLEQLLPGIALEVKDLLESCPNLRILTTSIQPLRIGGERVYSVGPLDPETHAVEFLSKALASHSRNPIGSASVKRELQQIAQTLEGYPLALKLASARFRLMSPATILEQLANPALLSLKDRDVPERHHSLEAALASSWSSLSAEQRSQLGVLAQLPSGAGLELAECFFGHEFLSTIDALLDSALLTLSDEKAAVRLTLLSPIRLFIKHQTEHRLEELRQQCIQGVQEFVLRCSPGLTKPVTANLSSRLEPEYENIVEVGTWLDRYSATAQMLARDIAPFEASRRRTGLWLEILRANHTQAALSANLTEAELILAQVVLLRGTDRQRNEQGLLEQAKAILQSCDSKPLNILAETYWVTYLFRTDFWSVLDPANKTLELAQEYGDPYFLAMAHERKAAIHHYQHEEAEAIAHLEASFKHYLACDAEMSASRVGLYLATVLKETAMEAQSRRVFSEAKPIALRQTSLSLRGFLAETEGRLAMMDQLPAEAEPHFREALRLWGLVENRFQQADQLLSLTRALLAQERWKEAGRATIESFEHWVACDNYGGTSACLANAAKVFFEIGQEQEAKEAASLMLRYRGAHSLALIAMETQFQDRVAEHVGAVLDPAIPASFENARVLMQSLGAALDQ